MAKRRSSLPLVQSQGSWKILGLSWALGALKTQFRVCSARGCGSGPLRKLQAQSIFDHPDPISYGFPDGPLQEAGVQEYIFNVNDQHIFHVASGSLPHMLTFQVPPPEAPRRGHACPRAPTRELATSGPPDVGHCYLKKIEKYGCLTGRRTVCSFVGGYIEEPDSLTHLTQCVEPQWFWPQQMSQSGFQTRGLWFWRRPLGGCNLRIC